MYSQEGSGNGKGEKEVTSPSHYIFEQFKKQLSVSHSFHKPREDLRTTLSIRLKDIRGLRVVRSIQAHKIKTLELIKIHATYSESIYFSRLYDVGFIMVNL